MLNDLREIDCPRCHREVRDLSIDYRLSVNHCAACKLLWLDHGELEKIVGTAASEHFKNSDVNDFDVEIEFSQNQENSLQCPRCQSLQLKCGRYKSIEYWQCVGCSGQLFNIEDIQKLRQEQLSNEKYLYPRAPSAEISENKTSSHRSVIFSYTSSVSKIAIPLAMLLGLVIDLRGGSGMVYLSRVLTHELGHSISAWLAGIPNYLTPVFVGLLAYNTVMPIAFFISGILAFALVSWIQKRDKIQNQLEANIITIFLALLLSVQIYYSYILTVEEKFMMFSLSGLLGEIIINTFLIVIFCIRSIPVLRWDFFRYPLMIYGAVNIVGFWMYWRKVVADPAMMPWGSALGGNEGDGDLAKLRDIHGFNAEMIIKIVTKSITACFIAIVAASASLWLRDRDDEEL